MKFGVNMFIWGAEFGPADFQLLPRLKEAGFDGIELPILSPGTLPADLIGRELQRTGLECTGVAIIPGGMSLASSKADIRAPAVGHVRECISAARDAGARLLAGPLYTPVGYLTGTRRTAEEWRRVVDSWQRLAPVAAEAGVEIAIEPLNRFETYFLNTADDAGRLCDEIGHPGVGILFDTFHANIEEKSIGSALRTAGRHVKHLHTCENDRGVPGSGHVEWPEFFRAVADIGYQRWMTIESFGFTLGALSAAAAIWRDLAPTPEAIAFEGLTFLRAHARG